MRTGRPITPIPIMVTTHERDMLAQWARRRTTAQAVALRARIIFDLWHGPVEYRGGAHAAGRPPDCLQMAPTLCEASDRGSGRCAAVGDSPYDSGCRE